MGIYDRDYYQDEQPRGISLGSSRSMVTNIVIINVAIYLVDVLFARGQLSHSMAITVDTLGQPWYWWRLLSAGFAHDPETIMHVGLNMFVLFMFGRDVEGVYGRKEFLRLYLVMIVFSMLLWAVVGRAMGLPGNAACVGASGAVAGVFLLFALHFPKRQVLLMFVIPVPAWVAGALAIGLDMFGATRSESNVAHSAHLAGMAFAAMYHFFHWNLGQILPQGGAPGKLFRRRPKLRVHTPDDPYLEMDREADRILDKLHRDGADSLTAEERRTLEDYSRRMRQKHR